MSISEIPPSEIAFINSLGGWERDQGGSGYSSAVAGLTTWAGGKYGSLDDIAAGDVPMFCRHGDQDLDMLYNFSSSTPGDTLFESLQLTNRASQVGITFELYTIIGGNHDSVKTDYAAISMS